MRSHAWLRKYPEYLKSRHPTETIAKTKAKLRRFAPGELEWRDSMMGAAILIWAGGVFKPALLMLIRGKAGLLAGACIIKKMDLTVNLGGEEIQVLTDRTEYDDL